MPEEINLRQGYPFGELMPGRTYNSTDFRYGFDTQEKTDEVDGVTGSHYTAENWEYDSRTARRWNIDALSTKYESPYSTFGNNPIYFTDYYGLKKTVYIYSSTRTDEKGNKIQEVNPSDLNQIQKHAQAIFDKNKVDIKVKVITHEEAEAMKNSDGEFTSMTDAFVELNPGNSGNLDAIHSTDKGAKRVNDLINSKYDFDVREAIQLDKSKFEFDEKQPGGGTIFYYQKKGTLPIDNISYNKSYFALGHELQHAWDRDQGPFRYFTDHVGLFSSVPLTEYHAVTFENYLRAKAGESKMRVTYSGHTVLQRRDPEYYLKHPDPLRKTEAWFVPVTIQQPYSDKTSVFPSHKAIRIDQGTGKPVFE